MPAFTNSKDIQGIPTAESILETNFKLSFEDKYETELSGYRNFLRYYAHTHVDQVWQ